MRRAQSSIELLLVLAALFALLLAFTPIIKDVRSATEQKLVVAQEQELLQTVSDLAGKVRILGEGSVLSQEVRVPVETTIVYEGGFIKTEFPLGNSTKTLAKEIAFPLSLQKNLAKGTYRLFAENSGGLVQVDFVPA
jgi:hypothetical protein